MNSRRVVAATFVTALLGLWLSAGSAAAQETGAVAGTILDANSQQPVADAQVFIEGTDLGTLSDSDGEYTIREVPVGPQTVVVQHIGHRRTTRQVQVQAGQSATADFELATDAVRMEELVVTGVGVTQQKKQLGQSVSTINAEDFADVPTTSVQDVLDGRVAGLFSTAQGETGSAPLMRLRSTVSISQDNQPLIYVDGVRIRNETNTFASIVSSTLADLNPENIERVEVLKGAAAATLYGTEASAGVIQIYTKRGANTEPRWSLKVDQQLSQMPGAGQIPADRIPDNVVYNPETGGLESIEPERFFLRTGHRQEYNASVRGGGQGAQYFGSAWFKRERGALPTNSQRNTGARAGLDFDLAGGLGLQTNVEFIDNTIRAPTPSWGLLGEATLASPLVAEASPEKRPYGGLFHGVPGAMSHRNTQSRDRFISSVQGNYQWRPGLTSRVTFGYESGHNNETEFAERDDSRARNPEGFREVAQHDHGVLTLDFSTAWETDVTESLSSSFTVGGQGFWEETREDVSGAQDYPAPGLKTLRGASSVYLVDESSQEVINAGVFGQEQVGINDRIFLTLGLRLDGSSAFGREFNVEPYPKGGFSWVLSDEDFWDAETVNHLRLRAAYGTSGLQPGAYDALRTWRAIAAVDNSPALTPQSIGNDSLKPERSVEREVGAELGFFDDRVGLDLNYYWQTTEDAILERRLPASMGFLAPQFVNIGELASKGLEASLNADVVQNPSVQWSVNGSFTWKSSEVTDLADIAAFRVSSDTRVWNFVKEGFSPGAVIGPVHDPDDPYDLAVPVEEYTDLHGQLTPNTLKNAAGGDSLVFQGHQLPTKTASLENTVRLPGSNLRFRMQWKAEAGFVMFDNTNLIRATIGITPRTARWTQELQDSGTSTERRQEIADSWAMVHPNMHTAWVQDADYVRLQNLSVTWQLPSSVDESLGLRNTRVTLSGRNLVLFTKYGGMVDPGVPSPNHFSSLSQNVDYYSAPIPPTVGITVRTGF